MKKIISILLVSALCIASVFAVDVDFEVGASLDSSLLSINTNSNTGKSKTKAYFTPNIDFNVVFDDAHMLQINEYLGFGDFTDDYNSFTTSIGYGYMIDMEKGFSLVPAAGMIWTIGVFDDGSNNFLGMYLECNARYDFGNGFFATVGVRDNMTLYGSWSFGGNSGKIDDVFANTFFIPTAGFGYRF